MSTVTVVSDTDRCLAEAAYCAVEARAAIERAARARIHGRPGLAACALWTAASYRRAVVAWRFAAAGYRKVEGK